MEWLVGIPCAAFALLLLGEALAGRKDGSPPHQPWDWALHLIGFAFQGAVIPLAGYLLATRVLPGAIPRAQGLLPLGWTGAFLLNFVFVDFLYYWQHRWFHRSPRLWNLHRCHHSARRVDVWVTARNTLVLHFFFVYFLVNPILGFLVTRPEAFFAGAMITAALDLFRHSNLDYARIPGAAFSTPLLKSIFVLPSTHHRHHAARNCDGNYGANFVLWDRLFGTLLPESSYPLLYGVSQTPHPLEQLLYPALAGRRKKPRASPPARHASAP
ncbi:MAG TPA: sterol desaturase family protein [Verrucomicrobiales bacterium]|nr:sterol desaturase family protein [Verrucomicrobiales bacterium]